MLKRTDIADGKILAGEVSSAIRRIFGLGWWTRFFGGRIYVSDEHYNAVNLHQLYNWLLMDDLDKKPFIPTDHDCDDFSFKLMGRTHEVDSTLAIGIVWVAASTYAHVLNFMIDKYGQFWFIEPQTDEVFKDKPRDWRLILAII